MGLLNKELYMTRLSTLDEEGLLQEDSFLKQEIYKARCRMETEICALYTERLECLFEYRKLLNLLETDND